MVVGAAEIGIRIEGAFSLKDKRHVVRSILDRARRDFGASAAETDDMELWNVATLGVAVVSNDPRHAEAVINKVRDFIDLNPDAEIESFRMEMLRLD